ncbi:MAG: 6-carboxytetrahydropterin synthase [Candidatus Manganitrophus sp.]|nr:6-carboxytetrahydropterin synthase [Candidatus Manganitrophus morganii]MDC4206365.1 6-carboxytetrahydropterin synthase [Candidatus Manganitrophus sp.]WDT69298.1 MAG: 6-carboxytetrahydropterin synthase [Candidatus Manganitrophus sp.]WDT74480.1 MAG: 6-carboxytetrahydropterin synthase [Candidatus Manganitrophus sp.]WDT79122.1 MAG: 6-carboxytetrahydropterin synthase [Candidatus Manganitrophus sp.]
MYKVTREIHFCYGHRLLNYSGKCRHLHGHNGKVEIELFSEKLNDLGMVRDFEEIKQVVQVWIDDNLDHNMILCRRDPLIPALEERKERYFLIDENPTAEAISKLIYDYAVSQKLPVSEVRLWETPKSFASYRES